MEGILLRFSLAVNLVMFWYIFEESEMKWVGQVGLYTEYTSIVIDRFNTRKTKRSL